MNIFYQEIYHAEIEKNRQKQDFIINIAHEKVEK